MSNIHISPHVLFQRVVQNKDSLHMTEDLVNTQADVMLCFSWVVCQEVII